MTNDATRASATALPDISRRNALTITGAGLAATLAGFAAHAAAHKSLNAEPIMTRLQQAEWHLRELERLIGDDGGSRPLVFAVADYGDDSGFMGARGINICEGRIRNDDGMFDPKGGAA